MAFRGKRDMFDFEKAKNECEENNKESNGLLKSEENNDLVKTSNLEIIIPSKIQDISYLYYPATFKACKNGGKWLIFFSGDLEKLDKAWSDLQILYHKNIISGIKTSTGKDTEEGVIRCYTDDSNELKTVKKAADEIRKKIDHDYIMYYKTNESSSAGKYKKNGCKNISLYMHTVKSGFYIRDIRPRWKYYL